MKTITGGLTRVKPPCRLRPGEGNAPSMPDPVFPPVRDRITDCDRESLRVTLSERGVLLPERKKKAKKLLVGFSETDAGVTLRERLALSCPDKIAAGATIAMYIYGIRDCVLCFPKSSFDAANSVISVTEGKDRFSVVRISDKYPLYDDRLLVSAVCGVEISPLKPLENSGYAVLSPETCVLICEALVYGLPAGKYFSVEGEIKGLYRCDPSETVGKAIPPLDCGMKITAGGSVRGHEVTADTPVGRFDGFIVGKKSAAPVRPSVFPCDMCGLCDAACPIRLRPSGYMKKAGGLPDGSACIGCRSCDYVCPSGINVSAAVRQTDGEGSPE